jgi:hypothetical protein
MVLLKGISFHSGTALEQLKDEALVAPFVSIRSIIKVSMPGRLSRIRHLVLVQLANITKPKTSDSIDINFSLTM